MIEWTKQAALQLENACDYIALSNNAGVADRIATRIANIVGQLESFPMLGRRGRLTGTRQLVISRTPFIAAYTVEEDRIVILATYHGAQRWPEAL